MCVPVKKRLSGRIAGIDVLTDEERAALDLYDPEIVRMRLLESGAGPNASLPGFNVVPLGGFRKRLDAMYEWYRSWGIEPRDGRGRHEGDLDAVRWRFADRNIATAFVSEFGGKMLRCRRDQ